MTRLSGSELSSAEHKITTATEINHLFKGVTLKRTGTTGTTGTTGIYLISRWAGRQIRPNDLAQRPVT